MEGYVWDVSAYLHESVTRVGLATSALLTRGPTLLRGTIISSAPRRSSVCRAQMSRCFPPQGERADNAFPEMLIKTPNLNHLV